jgi:hypothetical protein
MTLNTKFDTIIFTKLFDRYRSKWNFEKYILRADPAAGLEREVILMFVFIVAIEPLSANPFSGRWYNPYVLNRIRVESRWARIVLYLYGMATEPSRGGE